jgi:hypothetical protein
MLGIAFHGVDELWDQILALLQLDLNIGPSLVRDLAESDKAVVNTDHNNGENRYNTENDE